MTDIAIAWDAPNNRGDWSVANGGLVIGNDLETSVLLSLFTWRVLPNDLDPPDGTADRRGWWGDSFSGGYPIGSRLWTLYRAVKSDASSLLQQARDICQEALQWLLDDQVAASITVVTSWLSPVQMGIVVTITAPDQTVSTFKYQWAWKAIQ